MTSLSRGWAEQVRQLFVDARTQRDLWMARLPDDLRALLPLDATPLAQGIELLADAVGVGPRIAAAQREQSRANAAVLHGRVFGRGAPLSQDTALAAFADGAHVRDGLLVQLAEAVDGAELKGEVEALLEHAPAPAPDAPVEQRRAALAAVFAAQEQAVLLCAERLDAIERG